jgi:integrase
MTVELPRFVRTKKLVRGGIAYYFNVPSYFKKLGCDIPSEPLGTDYALACQRAVSLNGRFDEWRSSKKGEPVEQRIARFGTVDWLFREYKASTGYLERVSERSRPDYERVMLLLTDMRTKKGDRIGERSIRSITPASAEKIYRKVIEGPHGLRLRQGEKLVILCRRAWNVARRLHPKEFDREVPNPWIGLAMRKRLKKKKPAVTREEVYDFAWAAIKAGYTEPAAAAVICFEWLQRPENVLAGCITWTDYRGKEEPTAVKIYHHKTGVDVWHPLEEAGDLGRIQFYADAEAILAHLPRRGVPLILKAGRRGSVGLYEPKQMAKLVRRLADQFGLPKSFTLDACRHGGMTELEEAELTTGQGRALSGHKTDRAYGGYAKRTMKRALAATRKRHAHLLAEQALNGEQANTTGTEFRNEADPVFRNGTKTERKNLAQSVEVE